MPIIETHVLKGYSGEVKTRLGRALTDAVRLILPASPDAVTVMFHEMEEADYMRGGEHKKPATPLPDPCDTIRDYLGAMEARDLDKAQAMLGDGFVMNFPGAQGMTTLQDLIEWSKPRYRFVKKTYEGFEALQSGDVTVVYSTGTLYGEWPDGTPFEGIRYIDRFELTGGKITKQDVWNDIAEVRAQA
ncbi:tautomerase family protein [Thalassovita aquimarina]|uniref:Tautomerase family protein n=1 Tax=Thalassovita aquimarina TaxID=2785917 RepID=A0ABS5HQX4_9RHOB|nr:tautomerase family protein [Thalassovita aquimarina]MBR9651323.1 tautomerase family protein [Thalassovita aquimarina]